MTTRSATPEAVRVRPVGRGSEGHGPWWPTGRCRTQPAVPSAPGSRAGARMPAVTIQKLASTDGFIVFDLDEAPAAGIVRAAPKILVDGATLLARSLTYRFATFERQVGGASAGVNAAPDERAAAVAAFVAEVEPLVRCRSTAGRAGQGGRAPTTWRPCGPSTPGPTPTGSAAGRADRHSASRWPPTRRSAASAGRWVAIEGFDAVGPGAGRRAVAERGGQVVAVATADGYGRRPRTGSTPAAARRRRGPQHGPALVAAAGRPIRASPGPCSARRGRRAGGRARSPG